MRWPQALAAAAALSLGSMGWLARDLSEPRASSRRDPSLIEMVQALGTPPANLDPEPEPRGGSRLAPPPTNKWLSPLKRACGPSDPKLAARLHQLLANLPSKAERQAIDPSNFGPRYRRDAYGQPVDPTPRVVVMHETVYGIQSAINTFTTAHANDDDQVSYHALIGEQGQVVLLMDPLQRAFGAGNSAFNGRWVITNPKVGGSVNNFALHVSLETPIDGEDDDPGHSGYKQAQYDALAVLLAQWMGRFPIPFDQITTHRAVDLGGERADPRSFDWSQLQRRLHSLGLLC
jgi:N-acetyl-anhydromuramyl-L-alanine amidase AmpD